MATHLLWVTDPHLNFLSPGQARSLAAAWAEHDAEAPLVISGDVSEAPVLVDDLRELAAGFACQLSKQPRSHNIDPTGHLVRRLRGLRLGDDNHTRDHLDLHGTVDDIAPLFEHCHKLAPIARQFVRQ
jgi:hypothetical protein